MGESRGAEPPAVVRAAPEAVDAPAAEPPSLVVIAHARGLLRLDAGAVVVELMRRSGYRGTIVVPRERARIRVMGRAVAVLDGDRLVQLCSRCKPRAEIEALIQALGERTTVERRTSLAALLGLAAESAAYRPPEGGLSSLTEEAPFGRPSAGAPGLPPDVEVTRRAYGSMAAMERDGRRLRATGWVPEAEFCGEGPGSSSQPEAKPPPPARGLRRLLQAASPNRQPEELVVVWVRPRS